jgi:alpha-L-fucosidase
MMAAAGTPFEHLLPGTAQGESDLNHKGPFSADWASLQHFQCPDWFRDAKFGIYYHWGIYSVPAFATEWYPHWMYRPGRPEYEHHVKTYGPLDKFGYKDFIPMFTAEHWDPDAWVSLFIEAGAKYMGPAAEHSDGFSTWNSDLNPWNAYKMGPKRDLVGEMAAAVRRRGMKFLATFHHHWLWGWYESPQTSADIYQPKNAEFYWPTPYIEGPVDSGRGAFNYAHPSPPPSPRFNNIWRDKVIEVVDRYDPDLIYFDGRACIIPEIYQQQMLAYFYNKAAEQKRDVVMTFKHQDFPKGVGVHAFEVDQLPKDQLSKISSDPWQTDGNMDWSGAWSYSRTPDFKSATWLIHQLIDLVSKNSNFLLDVGPRPDGTIPEQMQERLRAIGAWLRVNGEAIYGTRPWTTFGEGPTGINEGSAIPKHSPDFTERDIRFTAKNNNLYIIAMGWPGASIRVRSVTAGTRLPGGQIHRISMLGSPDALKWHLDDQGLTIQMPKDKPCDHAFSFRLS